jgi:hypothetical protein
MQTFAFVWLEYHAAQQRLRETFAQSPLPDEESHLNSSPTVAQTDGETAGREVDPISPEATARNEGERAAKE